MNLRVFNNISPTLGERVYIDPAASVIGDVNIGNDSSVWPMAVIRGDVNSIEIGHSCSIQDGAVLHVTHDGPFTAGGRKLILENGITVGHQAVLHACHIEDYCLIGMGALILDAVHVEHHVMIAAGSVVTPGKRLLSGFLYLGNPARQIRPLTSQEIEQLEYSARHYVKLKDKYLEKSSN
ncbi:transferase [Legionella quinlivanii]|uniref:Transferase n=1 Tax=Legionella quinlivanii TaxID=45073 RepID=A0A0W0XYQ6_9GAMM|nr:gamma carbonic anhydrase family protein [Legionella quinlivanii]KTD49701.1 transferase [Legionella quinlivanii]SEG22889.1 Carbonic anhydrase or acetyltransferase, isoleucine patch superfamily [Legionella quinlivanii DSM 21216]STY09866.1 transferase [Legionella quinlivanii]